MRPGSSANQMSLIFMFGNAWHMSSSKRTSATLFNPTWNNACLLVIPVITRAGHSIIPPQRSILSLNLLNLMSMFSLALPSTHQHHQLISQLLTFLFHLKQLEGDGDVDDHTTATLPPVPAPELSFPPFDPPVDFKCHFSSILSYHLLHHLFQNLLVAHNAFHILLVNGGK